MVTGIMLALLLACGKTGPVTVIAVAIMLTGSGFRIEVVGVTAESPSCRPRAGLLFLQNVMIPHSGTQLRVRVTRESSSNSTTV